ncbi:hypothetical protein NE237_010974 [Protea cynaroides]|uniref:Uncharacterized protein n=1 Tax=Protea cynaroides TaxID=273540 RepID=A0A9Q0L0Q9_9MAGN|nr:hypothetical protein NE237_010974 [Protea cynaroides]
MPKKSRVLMRKAKIDLGSFKRKDKAFAIDAEPSPPDFKKQDVPQKGGIVIRSSPRLAQSSPPLAKTSKHKRKRLVLKSAEAEKTAVDVEAEGQLELARETEVHPTSTCPSPPPSSIPVFVSSHVNLNKAAEQVAFSTPPLVKHTREIPLTPGKNMFSTPSGSSIEQCDD